MFLFLLLSLLLLLLVLFNWPLCSSASSYTNKNGNELKLHVITIYRYSVHYNKYSLIININFVNLMYIGPCIIVIVEKWETNLMSQFIKFYFTSSILNMFQTLMHPSSGACDTDTTPTSHTETPTHIETRAHNQCGDTIKKYDGCINVRNMLSIDEVK